MARGPKKHLKRVYAPSHWMLDKLRGDWAPRPSCGPHKLRECMPLSILLRQRLKYALTYKEVKLICMQRVVKVDNKIRTDMCFPSGFMDVVSLEKTNQHFRLLYDTKGRFVVHQIHKDEAAYKLCRVMSHEFGPGGNPYITTHDGRTIRFPDPDVKMHDTVLVNLETGKIENKCKFEVGAMCMIKGGNNMGRVGVITTREKHPGSYEIIHVKDSAGNSFCTRINNVMCIGPSGDAGNAWISLPKGKGIKLSTIEDRTQRMSKTQK